MDKQKLMQLQGEFRIVLMQVGVSEDLSGKLAGKLMEKVIDVLNINEVKL